ncbi:Lrp/AsnC family transcriptional regulator [Halanaeroarchaeum sulfurireducens]|uniref:ArsR family transcriptional regulator n=1 Tax=Halanaeroarchaeum sulfurireducens TaxID=1604004 RepID=A0A0F7P9Q4_9EURY|nr:Lrp/AsnC family transcriptional regulator [Halanaeroarchaeum sulfurireducens]AKH97871.1 ArsR family transcriptional regulator [Halanaeroarchaeum sulfurireducens]ALG82265.1 ArsR family transcriptional regulator [Halanaeroarchaeum sulfurireducens]
MDLDDTDRAILRELQRNARTPYSEIARRIDMSSATVHDRVKRMEEEGVIRGYHADIDPTAVDLSVEAVIGFRIEQGRSSETLDRLEDLEEVQEVLLTTGEWDALVQLVARDTNALRTLMFDRISSIEGVERTQTMVVLGHEYDATELPL